MAAVPAERQEQPSREPEALHQAPVQLSSACRLCPVVVVVDARPNRREVVAELGDIPLELEPVVVHRGILEEAEAVVLRTRSNDNSNHNTAAHNLHTHAGAVHEEVLEAAAEEEDRELHGQCHEVEEGTVLLQLQFEVLRMPRPSTLPAFSSPLVVD